MKRKYLLTALLASFFIFVTFHGFDAHAAISGDEKCGKWDQTLNGGKGGIVNPCGINSLQVIFRGVMALIIGLGLPLLVVFVIFRFVRAWVALEQGNANAYKEAVQIAGQAILGFIVVTAVLGGVFLTILKYVGVKDSGDFNPLRLLQVISIVEVEHAYAAEVCPNSPGEGLQFSCTTRAGEDGYCFNDACIKITKYQNKPLSKGLCGASMQGALCTTNNNENGVCVVGGASCDRLIPIPAYYYPDGVAPQTSNDTASKSTATGQTQSDTKKDVGQLCYSSDECKPDLRCVPQRDKGTCQTIATYEESVKNATAINDARAQAGASGASGGEEKSLPNPLGFDDPYTFILSGVRLAIRFFFYPALIAIWTYCGFLYVAAQGAPDKLAKVHNLLLKAALTTFVVFATQGFLGALQGSVEKIVPGTTQTTQSTNP